MNARWLIWVLLVAWLPLRGQSEWMPAKSNRLVNDYAGMLSPREQEALESRLVAFNDSTSNQIVIVITPRLYGDEIKAVGQRIGESWGVGQGDHDNGLVILIKSKCDEEPFGEVAIVTGYGFEGAFPDVFCAHIINDYMINYLAEGNYYKALTEALSIIEPVAAGEYSYAQYQQDECREAIIGGIVTLVIVILVVVLLVRSSKKNGGNFTGGSHRGGFGPVIGGFGPSRGFTGGSSGGFGGFGGGSFGGGGASSRF